MKPIIFCLFCFVFKDYAYSQSGVNPALEHLIDYPNLRDFTLSKNGDEAYLTVQNPSEEISAIVKIQKNKESWSEPVLLPFSGKFKDLEPFLSPDNLKLYFASNRPLSKNDTLPKDFDIWYVERKSLTDEWGEAVNLGTPVNTFNNEFYPSLSENGNLYFTSDAMNVLRKDEILFSEWKNKKFQTPIALSEAINSKGYEFNAFIAPDESYLIFTGYNREGGMGSGDLYISYRDEKGNWQIASSLGASINSNAMDYCPYYDLTTKTLYFTSKRSNYSKLIDLKGVEDLKSEVFKYDNGFSRIYKVKIEL